MARSYQKMSIIYLIGDATASQMEGKKIIAHICNDIGKWGKGFVLAISKRWKAPEKTYKLSFDKSPKPMLGEVQFVAVNGDIIVASIIGQRGIQSAGDKKSPSPIRYDAVRQGLTTIAEYALNNNASIHMPRIGCGLAGGTWNEIEPIIIDTLIKNKIVTCVYDFS
jgi:O-acetyl-ADP-ribose deacetylase (regulator of RNase III)